MFLLQKYLYVRITYVFKLIPNVLNRHCRGMSMDSATSTQTAFMLREYAKMIESIEQHQDSILEENSSDLSIKLE